MVREYTSEKDIKQALNIKSFKNLSPEKRKELAKLLMSTPKDTAVGIINQLPEYASYMSQTLTQLNDVCKNILDSGKKAHEDTVKGYMIVLESLDRELRRKFLTRRRRRMITNEMLEIADKIAEVAKEHKFFLSDFFKTLGKIGLGLTALTAVFLTVAINPIKKIV